MLDQLDNVGNVLALEVDGCQDNPITFEGRLLHGGNFHAMPVGLASDQTGLAMHMAVYLAERQLGLLLSPATNGDLPPMLTPRGQAAAAAWRVCTSARRRSCRGSGSWSTRRR